MQKPGMCKAEPAACLQAMLLMPAMTARCISLQAYLWSELQQSLELAAAPQRAQQPDTCSALPAAYFESAHRREQLQLSLPGDSSLLLLLWPFGETPGQT